MNPRRTGKKSTDIKKKNKTHIYLKKREEKDTLHRETQLFIAFKKLFNCKGKNGLQVKRWEKIKQANANQRKLQWVC